MGSFREGLAPVELFGLYDNGKWGFIDKEGKEVIPIKYDWVENFSEGLAPVKLLNGKWGYIDKEGKVVIPIKYDDAWPFREGLALVKLNGKWSYIDKEGKVVIPIKYEDVFPYREESKFCEDMLKTFSRIRGER